MRFRILSTFSAAVLAAACLSGSSAATMQTPHSHILVSSCSAHRHNSMTQAHPWIDPYGIWHNSSTFRLTDGFLAVDYTNEAAIPATEIDFGLVARGYMVATANDVGTFSPGIAIRHEFAVSQELFPLGTGILACVVLRVKYADGSVWHNPEPPPQ
jgi:hypothetical protein